jgi:serine/threonine protein kinase
VSTPLDRLTASLADRLLREIEFTARLQHPRIPPLFDSGATPLSHSDPGRSEGEESGRSPTRHSERSEESGRIGTEFLNHVMPHVAGESLRDRLDRDGRIPVPEALGMTIKLACAA